MQSSTFYTLRDGERFVKNVFRGGGTIAGISLCDHVRTQSLRETAISRPLRRRYRLPYGGLARGSAPASNPTWPWPPDSPSRNRARGAGRRRGILTRYLVSKFSLSVISSPYSNQYVLSFSRVGSGLTSADSRMQQVTKTGRD